MLYDSRPAKEHFLIEGVLGYPEQDDVNGAISNRASGVRYRKLTQSMTSRYPS